MKRKPRFKIMLLVMGYWLIVMGLNGCHNQRLYKDNRVLMGTFVEVASPDPRAADIVFAEIERIEGLLSKYKADSEVAELNRLGSLKVSPDTFYIVKRAKEFYSLSDGAFDISVAPLVDLWGFTDKKFAVPQDNKIKATLALIGSDKIILNAGDNVIKFKLSGMKIDLGAIAKGYALDCALKKLKDKSITSCLINAGGQVSCLGDKFGKPWRVAVQNPQGKGVIDYLELVNKSVSTSGDYRQFFSAGAKKYAHILDPKTGYPADSGIVAVTVVAEDGLTADALSTTVFVLGKLKGSALVKRVAGAKIKSILP